SAPSPRAATPLAPWRAGGAPPDQPRADQCVECGRTVNLAEPVSHGLRGSHTCATPAGVIPPYLDPTTDAERGALLEYQHRKADHRPADLALAPTRPSPSPPSAAPPPPPPPPSR